MAEELALRRKMLFEGSRFEWAILYSGDGRDKSNPNFAYFSGCELDSAYLLLSKKRGYILTHRLNYRYAKTKSFYPPRLMGKEGLAAIRRAIRPSKLGFSASQTSFRMASILKKKIGAKLIDADKKILAIRSKKSPYEIGLIRKAAHHAKKILEEIDPWESKTELELAKKIKMELMEAGVEPSFEPIVASGKNTAYPHHIPSKNKLKDAVLVDLGAKYKGYCSDFTRCFFRRKGTREEKAYGKCKEAFWKIYENIDECHRAGELAALSEKIMKSLGLPPLIHAIGHGVGLEVHEHPRLAKKSPDLLEEGSVVAIEPAAYFEGYGVRYENMLIRGKKGWLLA